MNNAQIINSIFNAGAGVGSGGGGVIYGLQFNGISDFATFTDVSFGSYVEFGANLSDISNAAWLLAPNTGTAGVQVRPLADGRILANIGSQVVGTATYFLTGSYHIYRLEVSGTDLLCLRDGLLIDTLVGCASDPIGRQVGRVANLSTNSLFSGIEGLAYLDVSGTLFNDDNNWTGWTINGATRVQSTDGGITWTPA